MLQSEFERLQPIISTLFDIPEITLSEPLDPLPILETTIQYAHKLIEITQKIDQFRHRTANSHQAKIYNTILDLFVQCGYRDEENLSEIEMLEIIEKEIKRKNKEIKEMKETKETRESKEMKESKEIKQRKLTSRNETKRSKKEGKETELSKKEVTLIKQALKREEECWKEVSLKIESVFEKHLNQKRLKVEWMGREEGSSFYETLGEAVASNHHNLGNLCKVMDYLVECLPDVKSNKAVQLINEIEERENVFSYSMSRLMESIRSLKNPANKNLDQTYQNITTLISKLFDIYPNAELLRSLQLKQSLHKPYPNSNIKEYLANSKQTQCNIKVETKKQQQLKTVSLNFYKYRARIQQVVKRFEQSIKYKKVEIKELEKIFEEFREFSAWNDNEDYEEIKSYQEEVARITKAHQKKQAELKQEYNKSLKKAQKSLQAYQSELKELQSSLHSNQNHEQKLSRKLETQKAEKQKFKEKYLESTKTIQSLQQELEKEKSNVRSEQKQQLREQKQMKGEYQKMIKEKKLREQQFLTLIQKLKESQRLFQHQRGSFISKVKTMQSKHQHLLFQNTQTKQCLQQMISDNQILKSKLQQFTQIYQQKLHECQIIMKEFSNLQKELSVQTLELKEASIIAASSKSEISYLEKQLGELGERMEGCVREKEEMVKECERYKELGRLNENDVNELKVEFEKVHREYREVENENTYFKSQIEGILMEYNKVVEIQEKCNVALREKEAEIGRVRKEVGDYEEQNKFLREEIMIKENGFSELMGSVEVSKEEKKEVARLRREVGELRNSLTTSELQYNVAKQELQNMIQQQESKKSQEKMEIKSASSKHHLEMESLRMELKNKGEGWEREKRNYEREKSLNSQKILELEKLLEEKESLSNRIKGFKL